MYSIPSYCEFGNGSSSVNFLQEVLSSMDTTYNVNSSMTSSKPTAEAKAMAACKSHSEAERRRRKRINGHLATLRTLLPSTIKTDKASLLAEVVRRVRELKKETAELAEKDNTCSSTTTTHNVVRELSFPNETDELKLCYCEGDDPGTIMATMCCEDRPELISEMRRAVRSVEGKVVRAEMATVGGRMKSVLTVKMMTSAMTSSGEDGLGLLRRALKVVMDRAGQALPGNKRSRLSHY